MKLRARIVVLAFWSIVSTTAASSGLPPHFFEVRFADDQAGDVVATCQALVPCVVQRGLGGTVDLAVQIETTASDIAVGVFGYETIFVVRNAARSDARDVLVRRPGAWLALQELPARLRVVRYSGSEPCPMSALCPTGRGTDRRAGSGHLTIRPLPLAIGRQ